MHLHTKARLCVSSVDPSELEAIPARPALVDSLTHQNIPIGIVKIIEEFAGSFANDASLYQDACQPERTRDNERRRLFLAPLFDVAGIRFVVFAGSSECERVERKDGKDMTLGDVFGYFGIIPTGHRWVQLNGRNGIEVN